MADFLQKSVAMDDHKWHYDFHKVPRQHIYHADSRCKSSKMLAQLDIIQVSLAATAVFSYASILPASLYGFLWWAGGAGARYFKILVYFGII